MQVFKEFICVLDHLLIVSSHNFTVQPLPVKRLPDNKEQQDLAKLDRCIQFTFYVADNEPVINSFITYCVVCN